MTEILFLSIFFCCRGLSNATSPLGVVHESELEGEGGEFRPPAKPPTKHQWESDSSTKICRVCKTVSFNMVGRNIYRQIIPSTNIPYNIPYIFYNIIIVIYYYESLSI